MAKSVLGNDPFLRGAAERAPVPEAVVPPVVSATEPVAAGDQPAAPVMKKAAAKSAKASAKSATPAKPPARLPEARSKPSKATDGTASEAKVPKATSKPSKKPAAKLSKATSETSAKAEKAISTKKATAGKARPASSPSEAASGSEAVTSRAPEPLSVVAPSRGVATEEPVHFAAPAPAETTVEPEYEAPPLRPADMTERALGALAIARDVLKQATSNESLSRLTGAVQALFRALTAGLGTSGSTGVDAFGKDEQLSAELKPFFDFLYDTYWRVSVENAGAIPTGPVVIVANHAGALPLDGPVLHEAIRRERPELTSSRWLLEDQIFYAPFLGTLLNRLGAVRACPENAMRLLDEGRPVLVFPEGIQGISKPYRERYQLKRFGRGGFVKLALRAGAPIVPAAIVGAEESIPLLTKLPGKPLGLPYLPVTPLGPLPLPVKWSIRFGEPLELGGGGQRGAEDLARVQALTETTRQIIETMLGALIKERRSVFAG